MPSSTVGKQDVGQSGSSGSKRTPGTFMGMTRFTARKCSTKPKTSERRAKSGSGFRSSASNNWTTPSIPRRGKCFFWAECKPMMPAVSHNFDVCVPPHLQYWTGRAVSSAVTPNHTPNWGKQANSNAGPLKIITYRKQYLSYLLAHRQELWFPNKDENIKNSSQL